MKFTKIFISLIAVLLLVPAIEADAQTKRERRIMANAKRKYQSVEYYQGAKNLATVTKNYKWGFISTINGKQIAPCVYDFIAYNPADGRIRTSKNDKTGFFDLKGKLVIPCIYQDATEFDNGVSYAKKDGKWGIINIYGKNTVPFIYDDCIYSDGEISISDYVIVAKDGKYGLISAKGEIVIPLEYDSGAVGYYNYDTILEFTKDGTKYRFDLEGKAIK